MVMEDKAAIVHQHRATVIADGEGAISPNPEGNTVLNNNAVPVSPPVSPTSTGPVTPNSIANVYLIGLEFVRQYYTVLHQGPLYLHRFYSEQSSFVHDDSNVVYGQHEIRDRIQQLNFRNCVAKILQVDSQETLGNGVVIQVRGELSNNGQPLRRFMQTFVLAPQTPKRYYVRNDIFHYQDDDNFKDELSGRRPLDSSLSNEPNDGERSEEEEDANESGSLVPSVSAGSPTSVSEIPTPSVTKQLEGILPVEPLEASVPEVSLLDTKVEKSEVRPSHGFVASTTSVGVTNTTNLGTRPAETVKEPDQGQATTPSAPGGMKTFANLFKSDLTPGSASGGTQEFNSRNPFPTKPTTGRLGPSPTTVEGTGTGETTVSVSPAALSPQPPGQASESLGGKQLPPRGQTNFGRGERGFGHMRERRERLTSRSSNMTANDETGSVDGDNPRTRPMHLFPDSHQLFVGNLPHTVTVQEVKDIFEVFGRVAEVKILKPNQKNAGIKVPYFCFVVFDEQSSAESAIREKSKITMKMSDNSNRRLNVEEKRPRESMGGYGPPGGGGGGYYSRDSSKNENMANSSGSNNGPLQQGGGGNYRGGGHNMGPNASRGMEGQAARGGKDGGPPGVGDFRNQQQQQQNNPRTHTRTFRGSNRGGGPGLGGGDRGGVGGGGAR